MGSMKEQNGEVVENIFKALTQNPQTTEEIMAKMNGDIRGCPEKTIKILNMLRRKGTIKGDLSRMSGRWVWWK